LTAYIGSLHWHSDWSGYEVGYPEVNIVGLYSSEELDADIYVDTETGNVLEILRGERYNN